MIPAPPPPGPDPLPAFGRNAASPALPAGAIGLRLATPGIEGAGDQVRWPLHGSFRVPRASAGAEPEDVLRRIVLVVTTASSHDIQARHAFRDEVVFPEDVEVGGEFLTGGFHVDLLRTFAFTDVREDCFLTASIGDLVSDPIRCEAPMPWLAPAPGPAAPVEPEPPPEDPADDEGEGDEDTSWMVDEPL